MKRFFNLKKITAILLSILLTLSFASCNNTNNDTTSSGGQMQVVTLKVWGSQEDQRLLGLMIDEFKKQNTDKTYNISLGVVGENDAKTRVLEDPTSAADVFSFVSDQLRDLVNASALYEITRNAEQIKSQNLEGAVYSAMIGDSLFAYPMTADNGYFLYYDKSVLTENDVKNFETMLAAAGKAGKKVHMAIDDGWYLSSFFLGAGCSVEVDENGKQVCDFDNDTGVAVGEAVKKIAQNPAFISGDDTILTGGIGSTICAGISGTWTAEAIEKALGENYAATKLPTFNLNGEEVQMGSFAGYKLLGVSAATKHPVEAMKLAEFLTNEQNQIKRFEERKMGPSNINASKNEKINENAALAALALQNQFATSQKDILGGFWDPMKAFGTALLDGSDKSIKEQLTAMVAQIEG